MKYCNMTEMDKNREHHALKTFMNWYSSEHDRIREISEAWNESEGVMLWYILSHGLSELEAQTEIMKEADRQVGQ